MQTKRAAEGIAECEHALALDQNLAHAHALIGFGKVLIGSAEEAEAHVVQGQRLSPRDTMAYLWMNVVGIANSYLGRWERRLRGSDGHSKPTEVIRLRYLGWLLLCRSLID